MMLYSSETWSPKGKWMNKERIVRCEFRYGMSASSKKVVRPVMGGLFKRKEIVQDWDNVEYQPYAIVWFDGGGQITIHNGEAVSLAKELGCYFDPRNPDDPKSISGEP